MNKRIHIAALITTVLAIAHLGLGDSASKQDDKRVAESKTPAVALAIAPVQVFQKLLFITAQLRGSDQSLDFVVDTGARTTVLDRETVNHLHLQTRQVAEADASKPKEVIDNLKLGVGPLDITLGKAEVSNLSDSFPVVGRRFAGILGFDVFRSFVIEIDHEAGVLRFYAPTAFTYYGSGEALPLQIKDGLPFLRATLKVSGAPPESKDYVLDSGTADAINDDLFKVLANPARALPDLGRAESFQIGSFVLTGANGINGTPLIGQELLHRFNITYDTSHEKLYLEANRHFHDAFVFDMIGLDLTLTPDLNNIAVQRVFKGTPADEAGLKPHDVITRIDGVDVVQLGLDKVLRMFEEPHCYRLQVKRADKPFEVTVMLRKLL